MRGDIIKRSDIETVVSQKKFKTLINQSLMSFKISSEYENTLENVVDRVNGGHYSPQRPVGVYSIPKHNYVPRLIPVLSPEDNVLYHYLIKDFEESLLDHRPENVKSFGAYRILKKAIQTEGDRRNKDFVEMDIDDVSVGRFSLSKNWFPSYSEFQETVKEYFDLDPNKKVFVKTDVANFYDNIDLRLLENKVRSVLNKEKLSKANLLFKLLQGVNSFAYEYNYQGKGLPQDETSDCSRLLANFFLYDFDSEINEIAENSGCTYIRYCDDMIVMCDDEIAAKKIIHQIAVTLNKSSLSLNSAKTKIFKSRHAFSKYWLHDQHNLLTENQDKLDDQKVYDKMQAMVLTNCGTDRGYQLLTRWIKLYSPKMKNNPKLTRLIEKSLKFQSPHTVYKYLKNQADNAYTDARLASIYNSYRKSQYTGDLLVLRRIAEQLKKPKMVAKVDRKLGVEFA